ncbi:MAG: type II secretion system secretin GspD, partial [Gammaproteobacteria bacterium]|nr:type II secretion system secretin GspD [Gammaproteobacteria bacterium]
MSENTLTTLHLMRKAHGVVAFMLGAALFLAGQSYAADADQASITLNFKDSDIREVAASIGEITGKNFIIDPRVKGRVTVVSSKRISIDAVYATFLSVLQVHGFAAVPSGDLVKIVPAVDARQIGDQRLEKEPVPPGDEIITQVIEVINVPAAQLVPILRPLIPQYGHLAAYPGSNMLIISDRATNVERIMKIIRRIDQSSDDEVEVIALENASASETVRILSALAQGTREAGSTQPVLVADDRTNSILVSGDKTDRLRLRALISHLDTPLEQGGNTQVTYLRYADAESLSGILKTYLTEGVEGSPEGGGANRESRVVIIPDPATNALVITAPPKSMRSLQSVIEKLDIRRAQVLVEAIIVEITSDKASELGITWVFDGSESGNAAALTNFTGSGAGVVQVGAAVDSGDLTGAPDGITLGFGRIREDGNSFVGLLRALVGDSRTNILSTPSLVTLDNEEAEIKVGQEVPFLTGSFTNTG